MLKTEKYPRPLSQVNVAQLKNPEEEGGLNLGQVGASLRRRALLIAGVTGVMATAAVLKAESDPPVYQGEFEILTNPVTGESQAISNVPQTLGSQGAVSTPERLQPVETTIKVLQSPIVLDPVLKKLHDKYHTKYPKLDFRYDSVVAGLTIASKQQNILDVQFVSPKEDVARDFLKLLADSYLEYSLAERQSDVKQAIDFVEVQKKPLEQRVQLWQDRLRTLRQVNNLVEPTLKAQEVSTHIATLTQERLENKVQLEQMTVKYQDLQTEFAKQASASASNSVLSDNPRYQKLLDQILDVNAQIGKRSSVFTDEEEGMKRLNEQKAFMISMLEQERARVNRDFQSRIHDMQARDKYIGEKINSLNGYLRGLATVSREYDNIQRELKIATDGLNQFLTKEQSLRIEEAQKQQPWKLLDPKLTKVSEPQAISSGAKRNLALGGALGLLLGVGAALVVDKLSNVFYSSKEIKEASLLPLLGVVPFRKELGASGLQELDGALQQAARVSFFEVFRSLYTNILLLGSDAPIRSLVISSPGQEDGKSTVAIHLALAAAAMGQRVLLVDANLRYPTLHKRVGLMNIQGLTDVISQDLDWSNVIERSPLEDNLFVLAAGPIPPDSVRLLASQKMQDLMNELQASFDLVIYDTPPMVGFADANLLAANTNGAILVAGLGKLKRTVFQQALEEIQVSGTPILGVVANKSKEATPAAYSHYQKYYKRSVSSESISEDEQRNSVSTSSTRINRR
ncbi:MAG: polysaccharide biosynthesis tyrosine autokinase [Rhizonema sp. PD38]|nr:polysaccharide biosynthesis tyrosine autokinase [Rhizonema sp. PD38]